MLFVLLEQQERSKIINEYKQAKVSMTGKKE